MEQEDETLILCRVYALLAKAPHPDKKDIAESVNLLSRVLRQKNASGVELNSLPTPDQTLPANHAKQLALSAVGPNDATHNTAIAYVASQVQEKQNARNAE
jgi:hypothetical protein